MPIIDGYFVDVSLSHHPRPVLKLEFQKMVTMRPPIDVQRELWDYRSLLYAPKLTRSLNQN